MRKLNLCFLILIFVSCTTNSSYEHFLESRLQKKFGITLKDYNAVLMMPSVGCSGCISDAEYFVVQHFDSIEHVKFIFTKLESKKILKHKIGDSIYFNKDVFIDTNNIFIYSGNDKSIYPAIVYLSDGLIDKIEYKGPDNPTVLNTLLGEE